MRRMSLTSIAPMMRRYLRALHATGVLPATRIAAGAAGAVEVVDQAVAEGQAAAASVKVTTILCSCRKRAAPWA